MMVYSKKLWVKQSLNTKENIQNKTKETILLKRLGIVMGMKILEEITKTIWVESQQMC